MDIREHTARRFDDGRPVIATVKIVDEQEMPARNGRSVEYKPCIHWQEPGIKPYIPNKTNLKFAAMKLGTETNGWAGARIKMEKQPTQRPDGSMTEGIRFVAIKPPSAPAAATSSAAPAPSLVAPPKPSARRDCAPWRPGEVDMGCNNFGIVRTRRRIARVVTMNLPTIVPAKAQPTH